MFSLFNSIYRFVMVRAIVMLSLWLGAQAAVYADEPQTPVDMEWIRPSDKGSHFVKASSNERFVVWGVNYDHDETGRLLEDYWDEEWATVAEDFNEIQALGANLVRIHLQVSAFMNSPNQVNPEALRHLSRLVHLAEENGLYLDITGLGSYHKDDVPKWYAEADEERRWKIQARFWEAVAKTCAGNPAVFCYDLMNEPILPGKDKLAQDWLAGELGGKYFVQRLTLDLAGRSRQQVAKAWVTAMVQAIRKHDQRHMITVGIIPWALHFYPGAKNPLFYAEEVSRGLDFVSVHFYPESGKVDEALEALRVYDRGKPLLIEEMFPLKSSLEEMNEFVEASKAIADGWVSFYWGKSAEEYMQEEGIAAAIKRKWLEYFERKASEMVSPQALNHERAREN